MENLFKSNMGVFDSPKRTNDSIVFRKVILPFLKQQKAKELKAVTLPGGWVEWERNLRLFPGLENIPMHFTLLEKNHFIHEGLRDFSKNEAKKMDEDMRGLLGRTRSRMFTLVTTEKPCSALQFFQNGCESFGKYNMVYLDYCGTWMDHIVHTFYKMDENNHMMEDRWLLGLTLCSLMRGSANSEHSKEIRDLIAFADQSKLPDNVELEYSKYIRSENTTNQRQMIMGGANAVKNVFETSYGWQAKLKHARTYRRSGPDPKANPMFTLWFEISKNNGRN